MNEVPCLRTQVRFETTYPNCKAEPLAAMLPPGPTKDSTIMLDRYLGYCTLIAVLNVINQCHRVQTFT